MSEHAAELAYTEQQLHCTVFLSALPHGVSHTSSPQTFTFYTNTSLVDYHLCMHNSIYTYIYLYWLYLTTLCIYYILRGHLCMPVLVEFAAIVVSNLPTPHCRQSGAQVALIRDQHIAHSINTALYHLQTQCTL